MFWSMARVLQEISNELSHVNPDFSIPSEDTVVDQLLLAPTADNAREHPIFLQVMAAIDNSNAGNIPSHR